MRGAIKTATIFGLTGIGFVLGEALHVPFTSGVLSGWLCCEFLIAIDRHFKAKT